ncbi:hypothetical protein BDY19DRAFT_999012 [Irpex rosettiformis]|uniref:Uncharacterized protein n=1 Tax=Irpex rosettiformis TaxID=378272 RepID=A0ACB8TLW2_9APHY|nr:hypothetical protein BDY19DRAFT_999012 [Irpex rosettiformis]
MAEPPHDTSHTNKRRRHAKTVLALAYALVILGMINPYTGEYREVESTDVVSPSYSVNAKSISSCLSTAFFVGRSIRMIEPHS